MSRFKRARSYQQVYLRKLKERFGPLAFDSVIPDLAQFEKSVTDRIPITLHARSSEAAAIARRFFAEVERRAQELGGGSASGRRPFSLRTLPPLQCPHDQGRTTVIRKTSRQRYTRSMDAVEREIRAALEPVKV